MKKGLLSVMDKFTLNELEMHRYANRRTRACELTGY
jgi:hypothetical protein